MGALLVLAALVLGVYGYVMLQRLWAWRQLTAAPRLGQLPEMVSVILPVRNEARHLPLLLRQLAAQRYPAGRFEVLVVDDYSTDDTAALVNQLEGPLPGQLRLISLQAAALPGSKKAALAEGIRQATGSVLITTDGDCQVPPEWLERMVQALCRQGLHFLSGPVAYRPVHSVLEKLQAAEFAGLIGIGGASIALGQPNMCNGANLAFTREAYNAVEGYAGNEALSSGDDEFLLHKIASRFGTHSCGFLKDPGALVTTAAQSGLRALYRQRLRWASKWPHYQRSGPKRLALLLAAVYLLLLVLLAGALFGWLPWAVVAAYVAVKTLLEVPLVLAVLRFQQQPQLWPYALWLEVLYLPFVLAVGVGSLRRTYQWKGRNVR